MGREHLVETLKEWAACSIPARFDTAFNLLAPRDQLVLTLRYDLDGKGKRTLQECAGIVGVTRERVRQIEIRSVRRLRDAVFGERPRNNRKFVRGE